MAATTFSFEPKSFEALIEDRTTEYGFLRSLPSRQHSLLPGLPSTLSGNLALLNMPDKLLIQTESLQNFSWDNVQLPIALRFFLDSQHWLMQWQHQVFFQDSRSGAEYYFSPDTFARDTVGRQPPSSGKHVPPPDDPNRMVSGSSTYDVLYFYKDLPKYSAVYTVWVRVGDIETNRKTIVVELYENGTLVER